MNQSQELSIEFEAELGPISYCGKNHYQSSFKGTQLLLFISSLKDDKPIIFLYEIKTQWIHRGNMSEKTRQIHHAGNEDISFGPTLHQF